MILKVGCASLVTSVVLAIMILPVVNAISHDVVAQTLRSLRDRGVLGLGHHRAIRLRALLSTPPKLAA
jgi:ABC-type phosphate transport system permease subunit